MRQLFAYFDDIKLPIGVVQFDSWWYYKGQQSGIMLWEPMPSTLGGAHWLAARVSFHNVNAVPTAECLRIAVAGPAVDGPPSSWFKLPHGTRAVTHSRFFQANNDYITGKAPNLPLDYENWTWFIDEAGGVAVSGDERFFEHIFQRAKIGLGMATYEQDFLSRQYESCSALQSELGAGKRWLSAMAEAAESTNITLQYCMALPRHILQ